MSDSNHFPKGHRPSQRRELPFLQQMLLGAGTLFVLLVAVPRLLRWLDASAWIVPSFVLLAPLLAVFADLLQGKVRPKARNVVVLYALLLSRALFLIFVQFTTIPIFFLVGPVWLFGIFLTLVDVVLRLLPGREAPASWILCRMAGVAGPNCTTVLVAYHLLSAVLAFVAYRYGERLLDGLTEWHGRRSDWLEERLET